MLCVCVLWALFIQSPAISVSVSLPREALNSAIVFGASQTLIHTSMNAHTLSPFIEQDKYIYPLRSKCTVWVIFLKHSEKMFTVPFQISIISCMSKVLVQKTGLKKSMRFSGHTQTFADLFKKFDCKDIYSFFTSIKEVIFWRCWFFCKITQKVLAGF